MAICAYNLSAVEDGDGRITVACWLPAKLFPQERSCLRGIRWRVIEDTQCGPLANKHTGVCNCTRMRTYATEASVLLPTASLDILLLHFLAEERE